MKSKEIVLSKSKTIIFGIIIVLLLSSIISYGTYDVVGAFYGEMPAIDRIHYMIVVFPATIIVLGSILVGFILISMKYEKKAKKQDK